MPRYRLKYGFDVEFDAQGAGEVVPMIQSGHRIGGCEDERRFVIIYVVVRLIRVLIRSCLRIVWRFFCIMDIIQFFQIRLIILTGMVVIIGL